MVADDLKTKTLLPTQYANIAKEAIVCTDEAGQYQRLCDTFTTYDFVRHGQGEHGRGNVHTNGLPPE